MRTFLIRRLLSLIPLIGGITFLSFMIVQLAPGDYVSSLAMNPQISAETLANLRAQFGLDRHPVLQYLMWLGQLLRGNLGYSFYYQVPVTDLILSRTFNTLILSVCSIVFAWSLAIPIGIFIALRQNTFSDRTLSFMSFFGMSVPNFFFAFVLLFLAKESGWLPVGGTFSPDYNQYTLLGKLIDRAEHLIIPVVVLGTSGMAGLMRLMRGQILEIKNADYVRTARAKGLSEFRIISKHILKNALNPFVTLAGYELGALLGGSALVEAVLNLQGLGTLMLQAVMSQDLYLIMGSVLIGALLLIIGNLIADIALVKLDPRISFE
jgi:peptide/nickel transport system permease protein